MARKRSRPKSLQTIWEVSDDLWTRINIVFYKDAPDGVFKAE